MKIITRYILAEITPIFIIGNVFFVFLLLLDKLIALADLFFTRNVPGYLILETIVYYLPSFFVITIPTSVLLASLIGFSRLSVDSELIVLRASGASGRYLLMPTLCFGLIAMLLSLSMSTWLMPIGSRMAIENLTLIAKTVSVNDIKPNELYTDIPGMVVFAKEKDENGYQHLVVIDKNRNVISSSKSGEILTTEEGELIFSLREGSIVSEQEDGYSSISFNHFLVNIPIEIKKGVEKLSERFMTLSSLIDNFSSSSIFKSEFSSRFSLPFAALIMSVLGMALGSFFSRTGKSFGVFIAISLVFFYNAIFIISKNMSWLNPFAAPWVSNIIFIFLAVFYYRKIKA